MYYPLIIVTVHNRRAETERTLRSLRRTVIPGEAHIVLIDNGSRDRAAETVRDFAVQIYHEGHDVAVHLMPDNMGCPAALNFALDMYRSEGQPVVKVDSDVDIVTPSWVQLVGSLLDEMRANETDVFRGPPAMIGAVFGHSVNQRRLVFPHPHRIMGADLWLSSPIIGHVVWHTGEFMDRVGFFDVLHDDHLYGFEDLVMSHKATAMGWVCGMWSGWSVIDLQRHSSLPRAEQEAHIARMRPEYDRRVAALRDGGSVWTGADGGPATRP